MNRRSSVALAVAFGILIALIAGLGIGAIQRASVMYSELKESQDSYLRIEALCRGVATNMYSASVLVRDFLLDSDTANLPTRKRELIETRSSIEKQLGLLSEQINPQERPRLDRLQTEAQAFWDTLDPMLEWTAGEKAEQRWIFLARKVLPHRDNVVSLARELMLINNNTLDEERKRLAASQQALRDFLTRMIAAALGLGTLVAGLTIYRVQVLEKMQAKQRQEIEDTQNNLRRLSQRLVELQEGERRSLSRELHDQVGQTMTALGIQLGNIEDLRSKDGDTFHQRLEDLKRLNADAMRTVRDLAMGLRPSMLDDIGLDAALQWQGREFARHTGVPCRVQVDASLNSLTEAQTTCIYRVVQEALTNCARHARAHNVMVSVSTQKSSIDVMVRDDGVGFNSSRTNGGSLGLLGMKERVQALDGKLTISSERLAGTTVRAQIPIGIPA